MGVGGQQPRTVDTQGGSEEGWGKLYWPCMKNGNITPSAVFCFFKNYRATKRTQM